MEQLQCCDLMPRASLVRAGCNTGTWEWDLGRRGYWMYCHCSLCNRQISRPVIWILFLSNDQYWYLATVPPLMWQQQEGPLKQCAAFPNHSASPSKNTAVANQQSDYSFLHSCVQHVGCPVRYLTWHTWKMKYVFSCISIKIK